MREYCVGEWKLIQRKRSGLWCRTRYCPEKKRGLRYSLGTKDFEQAKIALHSWFRGADTSDDIMNPKNVPLLALIDRYYRAKIEGTVTQTSVLTHIKHWEAFWGEAKLSEATVPRQRQFHEWMRELGHSQTYISRIITTGRAAVNHAFKQGEISAVIPFVAIEKPKVSPPKGRPMSVEEVARLLKHSTPEVYRACLFLMGTAARPGAILELHCSQIDMDSGTIALNPEGRDQNRKYRPTVKLPEFLRDYITMSGLTGYVVSGTEETVPLTYPFKRTRAAAGLEDVTLYSFRHTMARWMRSQSVPPWEVSAQLGHVHGGFSMTERYAPFDPNYLSKAVEAIDEFYARVWGANI